MVTLAGGGGVGYNPSNIKQQLMVTSPISDKVGGFKLVLTDQTVLLRVIHRVMFVVQSSSY